MKNCCLICRQRNKICDLAVLTVTHLYKCNDCGIVFANPNFQNPDGNFFDTYRVNEWLKYYRPFRSRSHRGFIERNYDLLFEVVSVLDIGCAAGWFLDEFRRKNPKATTVGIEPSLSMKKRISEKMHRIYWIPAKKLNTIKDKFNLISFWNVFEHFSNPHAMLDLVARKLERNGILILSVPNQEGLISRLSYFIYHLSGGKIKMPLEELFQTNNSFGHLFQYSRKSLTRLLNRHGFHPIRWEKADIVDIWNVKQRLKINSYQTNEACRFIITLGVVLLTLIGRITSQRDEIVVIARKNA